MKYEAAIFDLDGTLLDSIDDIRDSLDRTLKKYSLPGLTRAEALARVGNGSAYLVEHSIPGGRENGLFEDVLGDYSAWYDAHCMIRTRPYDGIPEALRALRGAGVLCAIVSNKPDGAVGSINERFFAPYMEAAVGERAGIRRKPAPDAVFAAMETLGAAPEKCVYIGDTEVDIMTARAAGIDCISVLWGFRSRRELETAGAETFALSPDELPGLIL